LSAILLTVSGKRGFSFMTEGSLILIIFLAQNVECGQLKVVNVRRTWIVPTVKERSLMSALAEQILLKPNKRRADALRGP
jgi:hypothetical protein